MNIQLHFIEKGAGKPLILLHGNGDSSVYFAKQIEYFSKKHRVIAVDTRGHGNSPRGENPFTISQFADDLKAFMNRLNIKRADILGFSDGGNIALVFAMRYPERIYRLVIDGANLNEYGVKRFIQIPITIGYHIAMHYVKKYGEKDISSNQTEISTSSYENKQEKTVMTKTDINYRKKYEKSLRLAERLGLMVNDPNIKEKDLEKIKVRTLVIAGTRDIIKKEHTKAIYNHLPNAELVFISGNHFIANKNHIDFNRVVDEFLEESDSAL